VHPQSNMKDTALGDQKLHKGEFHTEKKTLFNNSILHTFKGIRHLYTDYFKLRCVLAIQIPMLFLYLHFVMAFWYYYHDFN